MSRRIRNKKKTVNSFVFPAPFAGVIIMFATFALGYVWLGCGCESLGKEIKALELRRDVLEKRCLNEEYKWTRIKSPGNLERTLGKYGIKMIWPGIDQVVRLYDNGTYGGNALSGVLAASKTRFSRSEKALRYHGIKGVVMND